MRLRRRPRTIPAGVKGVVVLPVTDGLTVADLPGGLPPVSDGDEIMRLRKAMRRAVSELYADRPDDARRLLSRALAERWWT